MSYLLISNSIYYSNSIGPREVLYSACETSTKKRSVPMGAYRVTSQRRGGHAQAVHSSY